MIDSRLIKVPDRIESFEWDANKRETNLIKHGIDFEDAIEIFYEPIILQPSNRNNEERWIAIGFLKNILIAAAFTHRGNVIRIISARRARKNEEREYNNTKMGRPP